MSLRRMTAIAIFAALLAVCSQFFLPIGPVPHTLQIFAITLAGIVLGAKDGAASVVVWILLGSFGLPVFAMAQAGPAVVFGPLVGFFGGFIFHAAVCGYLRGRHPAAAFFGAAFSLTAVYALGVVGFWAEYMYLFQKPVSLYKAFAVCALPFIPFDLIKTALALFVGRRIVRLLTKAGIRAV